MNNSLVPVRTSLIPMAEEVDDAVIEVRSSKVSIIKRPQPLIKAHGKSLKLFGVQRIVTAEELARTIKHITQSIGEYKTTDTIYANVVVTSLRKARNDLVSILEKDFRISFEIDENGCSRFYYI